MHDTEDEPEETAFMRPPPYVPDSVGVQHELPDGVTVMVRLTFCGDQRYRVMFPNVCTCVCFVWVVSIHNGFRITYLIMALC